MIKAIEALKISLQRRKEIDEDEMALYPGVLAPKYEVSNIVRKFCAVRPKNKAMGLDDEQDGAL